MEEAITFDCGGSRLVGILHRASSACRFGVLIVVGGPQYRVGSHRQFTLLARHLAAAGIPALRFDYRGMGDSEGDFRAFDSIREDIGSAIQEFMARVDGLDSVVIWGLCDAASAALFYAQGDDRVRGLVLLNPWVRTETGEAATYIRHYYTRRILEKDFWKKVLRGGVDIRGSLVSFAALIGKAVSGRKAPADAAGHADTGSLPERMCSGFEKFGGPVLVILSGNQDYVADEFRDMVKKSRRWKKLLGRDNVVRRDLVEANHTFSRAQWRGQVERWTSDWVKGLEQNHVQ